MSATQDLLDFASADLRLSGQVRAATLRLIADTLAVGAAGWSAPGMAGVLATVQSWGAGGSCRLLGDTGLRMPANGAVYANCFAIHCLEWDAVHEGAVVHAMTAVIPAVMAAVDQGWTSDPEEVLAAVAVGVDVAAGLGLAARGGLKFFRPAITGVYGAALAAARIRGLPRGAYADVLGLAHAHAAGTMQAHSEGSIALPLQFANAARSALHAVELVAHGLTGPHDPLEGPFGHFALFEDGALADYTAGLGTWRIAELSTKPFPSGRASHGVLGAIASLHGADVVRVAAHVPPLIRHLVDRPMRSDMNPVYARLCLPFLIALMLRDGAIDPRAFTSETFADRGLAALAASVEILDDGNPDPNAMAPQRIDVVLANGEPISFDVPATLGSPERPLSDAEAAAKYAACQALAPVTCDPRLFSDPLAYLVNG